MCTPGDCYICYEPSPRPIHAGCACRAGNEVVHSRCAIRFAAAQHAHRGDIVWSQCPTCGRSFGGEMLTRLALAWVAKTPAHSGTCCTERILALCHAARLSMFRVRESNYADAVRILRAIVGPLRNGLGNQHLVFLKCELDLAVSLTHTGRTSESNWRFGRVVRTMTLVYGARDPLTLAARARLAACLLLQHRATEPERVARDVRTGRTCSASVTPRRRCSLDLRQCGGRRRPLSPDR
jgi:hypothetical protein